MEKVFLGNIYGHPFFVEIDKKSIGSDEELEVVKQILHKYFRDANDAWINREYKNELDKTYETIRTN